MPEIGVAAPADTIRVFLDGARVVVAAIADPVVAAGWDRPSVLTGQTVGGLCGHLARGAVWVVGDYLDAGEPPGPVRYHSADEYYADLADRSTEEAHAAIRARGAAVAAGGHDEVLATVERRHREPRRATARPGARPAGGRRRRRGHAAR